MTKVHDERELHVTDIREARNDTPPVDAVVTVCQDSIEDNLGESMEYYYFPLADGATHGSRGGEHRMGVGDYQMFKDATNRIRLEIRSEKSVLVHCHAGVSRSPSTLAAALAVVEDRSFGDVLLELKENRPRINPGRDLLLWGMQYVYEYRGDKAEPGSYGDAAQRKPLFFPEEDIDDLEAADEC